MEAGSWEDFFDRPVGRYVVGQTFCYLQLEPKVNAVLLWGRLEASDALQLTRFFAREEKANPWFPEATFVDARRIEGSSTAAFAHLEAYWTARWHRQGGRGGRNAVVRPSDGIPAALVAGFVDVFAAPRDVRVFADPLDALDWMGRGGETLLARVEQLAELALRAPLLLSRLQEHLGASLPEGTDLASEAHALGLSPRSLQRQLAFAQTTFREQLQAARVKAAQRLMLDTDATLTTVALDAGWGSPQHFSAAFHRLTGEAPSEWRRRQRQAQR